MRLPPKRIAQPADGLSPAEEPDDAKAARLLAALRWMTATNTHTLGITDGDAQFMVVRFRPQPNGPHNPAADLRGQTL